MSTSLKDSPKTGGSTVIVEMMKTLPQLIEQREMVYGEADGLLTSLKPVAG
jgi:hypothetical protein